MCTDKHAIHALTSAIALVPYYAMSIVLTHTLSTVSVPYTLSKYQSHIHKHNVHSISPTYTQCPSISPTLTHTHTHTYTHPRARAHTHTHTHCVQVSVPHARTVRSISATYLAYFGLTLKLRHPKI